MVIGKFGNNNEVLRGYIMECPVCKGMLEHIEGLDSHAGDFNGNTTSNSSYRCLNCKSSVNIITEKQNSETMFMRIVYRKNGYKERIKIL